MGLINAIAALGGAVRYAIKKIALLLFVIVKTPFVLLLKAFFALKDSAVKSFRRVVGDEQFFTGRAARAFKGISYAFRREPKSVPAVVKYYAGRSVARYGGLARYLLLLAAPTAAGLLFLFTFLHFKALSPALRISVGGEVLGVAADESEYMRARAAAANVLAADPSADPVSELPEITLSPVLAKRSEYTGVERLSERILTHASASLVNACGVYVDGALLCAVRSEAQARQVFADYLNELSAGAEGVSAFQQEIRFVQGLYPENGVRFADDKALRALISPAGEDTEYVSDRSLTVAQLAAAAQVPQDTLLELNPQLAAGETVPAGTAVVTARAKRLLTLRTVRAEITRQDKPFETVEIGSDALYIGTKRTVVQGVAGTEQITHLVTYVDGRPVSREEVSRLTLREPVAETLQVGTRALDSSYVIAKSFGGILLWPAPAANRINSDYAYRWGRLHAALDIGSSSGTSYGKTVVAAAQGTVVIAGVHSSYGYYVKIDHGNGLQTLYAHCMAGSLMVSVGEKVLAGQPIARIGQTGYATGPHLHFEVIVNGVRVDPKPYLGLTK